jgi:integration host factor subunit alpha
MNEMNSSDFEALLAAQRGAMIRDISTPSGVSGETPTLTKAELAEMLFDNVGLNKREAKDMVEAFFEVIRDALEGGDSVKLSGFGNFQLRDKPQRPGRNPKTGEAIPIAARRVVTFHASQKLKAVVENGAEAASIAR